MITKIPTYKFNNIEFHDAVQKKLDLYSILYFKHWYLYVDDNHQCDINFLPQQKVAFCDSDIESHGEWRVVPDNKVIISLNTTTYVTRVCYLDEKIMILQVNENKNVIILIAQLSVARKELQTLQKINSYLEKQVEGNQSDRYYKNREAQDFTYISGVKSSHNQQPDTGSGSRFTFFTVLGYLLLAFTIILIMVSLF